MKAARQIHCMLTCMGELFYVTNLSSASSYPFSLHTLRCAENREKINSSMHPKLPILSRVTIRWGYIALREKPAPGVQGRRPPGGGWAGNFRRPAAPSRNTNSVARGWAPGRSTDGMRIPPITGIPKGLSPFGGGPGAEPPAFLRSRRPLVLPEPKKREVRADEDGAFDEHAVGGEEGERLVVGHGIELC